MKSAYEQPIIIKKVKKAGHAHHGGAWKIAYADFVTAMMAFFLLLWLVSMTTPEQKKGLAHYFAPPNASDSSCGAGGVMGGTAFEDGGSKMSGSAADATDLTGPQGPAAGPRISASGAPEERDGRDPSEMASAAELQSKYDQQYHAAAASIRQAWQSNPDIAEVATNLIVDETEDGLNIKLIDRPGEPMFPEGSKFPFEKTREAIAAIAPVLQKLGAQIQISGHVSAGTVYENPRYGAWELSMDRANTVRLLLGEFGLSENLVSSVVGRASADPLFPNDPYLAGNERVEISVIYASPPVPPNMSL